MPLSRRSEAGKKGADRLIHILPPSSKNSCSIIRPLSVPKNEISSPPPVPTKSSSFFSQHFSRTLTKTITTNPEPSTSTTRCPNFAQGEEDDLAKALLAILRVTRFC